MKHHEYHQSVGGRYLRVEHALVHVFVLGNAGHDNPEDDHDEDALPHGRGNLVPHLIVEMVDLLEALEIVEARGSVGDGPHAEVVHVSEDVPVVLEGDLLTRLKETVLVGDLSVVLADAEGVANSKLLVLEECQLVHYSFYIIL